MIPLHFPKHYGYTKFMHGIIVKLLNSSIVKHQAFITSKVERTKELACLTGVGKVSDLRLLRGGTTKGFTLIELLVVIAVLGILAGGILIALNIGGTLDKATLVKAKKFAASLENGLAVNQVGKWSFEEVTGGITSDTSGYANNGTVNGATPLACGLGFGGCLDFDGTDEVQISDNAIFDVGKVTLALWVYPRNTGVTQVLIIRDDNDSAGGCANYSMRFLTTGKISYTDCLDRAQSSTVLQNNRWYHAVVTFDGTNSRVYINGILESTDGGLVIPNVTSHISIGGWLGIQEFDGLIDEVQIYNQALTLSQIHQLYASGLVRKELSLR